MAETKAKPAAADADATLSASSSDTLQPLAEAWQTCMQAMGAAQQELWSRLHQGQCDGVTAVQEQQARVHTAFQEAEQELGRTVRELASPGADAQARWEEARRGAADSTQRAQQEAQEALARIQQQQSEAQGAAWAEACQRCDAAQRDYLRAVQAALQQVDASSFDLGALAPIGQSLIATACYATGLRAGG